MARSSQDAVIKSIESYIDDDLTAKNEILELSSKLVFLQNEVSELTIDLIARFQPVATDLRFIKACMEISYGFSRFGRYAYDIIEVLEIIGPLNSCNKSFVHPISKLVLEMMSLSISSLRSHDISVLKKVYEMEEMVDALFEENMRNSSRDNSSFNLYSDGRCNISAALVLKYLERISDHACYIAHSVNYVVTGTASPRS